MLEASFFATVPICNLSATTFRTLNLPSGQAGGRRHRRRHCVDIDTSRPYFGDDPGSASPEALPTGGSPPPPPPATGPHPSTAFPRQVPLIVVLVVIGLPVLGMIVTGFANYGAMGIIWLVGALIWAFVALLFARVGLELVVIFFRIRDNTEKIVGGKRQA